MYLGTQLEANFKVSVQSGYYSQTWIIRTSINWNLNYPDGDSTYIFT